MLAVLGTITPFLHPRCCFLFNHGPALHFYFSWHLFSCFFTKYLQSYRPFKKAVLSARTTCLIFSTYPRISPPCSEPFPCATWQTPSGEWQAVFIVLHSKGEHSVCRMWLRMWYPSLHFHAITDCMKKGNRVVILWLLMPSFWKKLPISFGI